MKIKSYLKEYEVEFCRDFSFLSGMRDVENAFYIIDKKVYQIYGEQLQECVGDSPCYLLESVETNKNIDMVLKIIDQMVEMKSKRNTVLISVGGGIVQDVSGFIANILYRGIAWIWIPTTLLAQADSCIGSKTSLNYRNYKNLLGYFYPPDKIYISTGFIGSLERKDYLSGLGEIMKCAIMAGTDSFYSTKNHLPELLEGREEALAGEIKKALEFKKAVIEVDEFDTDTRNIMNYGHTFGHALESSSSYAVPHGQAVSVGMLIANEISYRRGYIKEELREEMCNAIRSIVSEELIEREYFSSEGYLAVLKKDKKYTGGTHTCILLDKDGKYVKRYKDITDQEIINACEEVLKSYNK